jgi:hypothetical protein
METLQLHEIPADLLINAPNDYSVPSFTTSGGWAIFAQNNSFMRLSAIGAHEGITYFIHLRRDAHNNAYIDDADDGPAVICSDGTIIFMHRPPNLPHIMIPTKYCDIEIFLCK